METLSAALQDCNPRSSERGEPVRPELVTWELLVELEPRLLGLLKEAQSIKDNGSAPSFCGNKAWQRLREKLHPLIGYGRKDRTDPRLTTHRAWDVCRAKLYNAVPDCRACSCVVWNDYIEEVLASRGQTIPRIPFSSASPQVPPGT